MAQNEAPNPPQHDFQFVDIRTGQLTSYGLNTIDQLWRQIAAGYVVVPCTCTGTDDLTLTPTMHAEGARTYGNYMFFSFTAENTSAGDMTARVQEKATKQLAQVKLYKDGGATRATANDVVAGRLYLAAYVAGLDGGAGGLVLFSS